MDLFKQLSVRLQYVAEGEGKYLWLANRNVIDFKASKNLNFQINSLTLAISKNKNIEIDDKGMFYNFKK